jgi:hypothetical protein
MINFYRFENNYPQYQKYFNNILYKKYIKSEVIIADLGALLSLIYPPLIFHWDKKAFILRFSTGHISDPIFVESRSRKLIFQKLHITTSNFCENTQSFIFLILDVFNF